MGLGILRGSPPAHTFGVAMMREPRKLLAHLEGKLTQQEEELLRLMRAWAEGSSEVSEEEIRARLREVPLPRRDLLEAVIRVQDRRCSPGVQKTSASVRGGRGGVEGNTRGASAGYSIAPARCS